MFNSTTAYILFLLPVVKKKRQEKEAAIGQLWIIQIQKSDI